jgi:putative ABC transport system permease protein
MIEFLQTVLARGWRRLAFRWRRGRLSKELAEEIEFHRASIHAEPGAGNSRMRMGNITLAQEDCRDMWSFVAVERLVQDIRFASRMFRRSPVFTAIVVLSLALGIGGNAAMFSLVDRLLVRSLPYPDPGRLVRITGTYPRAAVPFFQQRSRTMDVAAVSVPSEFNLTGNGEAVRIFGSAVSASLFPILQVSVARGRSFESGEDSPGRDMVAILSDSLWRNKFGGDPETVGRVIALNGIGRRIIGIMPPGFAFPSAKAQLWIPLRLDSSNFLEYWGTEFVPLVARLRLGITAAQSRLEVRELTAEFRKTFPYPMARDWNSDPSAIPLQEDAVGDVRGRLIVLLGSVGMVLLIACANVASLLLSRATTRRKEIALRVALGAGRLRIVRQLLTESVLLAFVGAALGMLLGMSALSIFKSVLPASLPGLSQAAIDWDVAAVVAALSLSTGLAFGIAPALSAAQIDLAQSIRTGSQRSTTAAWARLRSWLTGAEVALTVVLVVSAGLLIQSLYTLSEARAGFLPEHILTVRISPNQSSCTERPACIAYYERLLEAARGASGVVGAAIASTVPLDGTVFTLPVDVEGHPKTADHPAPMVWSEAISPGYMRLMRIPLLAGRNLTESDGAKSAGVVLISAATARHFWPDGDPIGKHIKTTGESSWRTIVGVVGDVRHYRLSKALPDGIQGAIYMPYAQAVREDLQIPAAMALLVKTSAASGRLAREIRSIAEDQNPNVPVGQVQSLEEIVSGSISDFRSTIRVFLSFAAAAILLAAIGIYGLVSHWVTQRTYEIGLRLAIGATRKQVVSMILSHGLRVALYGIAAGILTALAATRLLTSLLYGVASTDPRTFAAVALLVLAVTLAATAFPAWRASRIDPVTSLRVD